MILKSKNSTDPCVHEVSDYVWYMFIVYSLYTLETALVYLFIHHGNTLASVKAVQLLNRGTYRDVFVPILKPPSHTELWELSRYSHGRFIWKISFQKGLYIFFISYIFWYYFAGGPTFLRLTHPRLDITQNATTQRYITKTACRWFG